jgi:hypothetical protein
MSVSACAAQPASRAAWCACRYWPSAAATAAVAAANHLLGLTLRPAHVLTRRSSAATTPVAVVCRWATATPSSPTALMSGPASRSRAACSAARRAADACAMPAPSSARLGCTLDGWPSWPTVSSGAKAPRPKARSVRCRPGPHIPGPQAPRPTTGSRKPGSRPGSRPTRARGPGPRGGCGPACASGRDRGPPALPLRVGRGQPAGPLAPLSHPWPG